MTSLSAFPPPSRMMLDRMSNVAINCCRVRPSYPGSVPNLTCAFLLANSSKKSSHTFNSGRTFFFSVLFFRACESFHSKPHVLKGEIEPVIITIIIDTIMQTNWAKWWAGFPTTEYDKRGIKTAAGE